MELRESNPIPSVTWHIVWQAVAGRDLLHSAALAEHIRARALEAHRLPGRALLHYLIMPTELHLLSRLPAQTPPRELARTIGNVVARRVRQFQGMAGVVFASPYRAYAIEKEEAIRREFRMLAWRPVVTGLCAVPIHHVHSSLRTTLGLSETKGFDVRSAHALFASTPGPARAALRATIGARPGATELRQWELARGMALATGALGALPPTTRSIDGLAAALVAASRPQDLDGALALLEHWVLLKLGHREAADLASLSSPAGVRARALVAGLAVRLDLCPAAAVARRFGRAKATLSERLAACRRERDGLAILEMPLERVVAEAIALRDPRAAT